MLIRKMLPIPAVAVLLALAGCTTLPVTTDTNPNASVGTCHTYAWAHEHYAGAGAGAAYANPLNADRLRVAIQSNLAAHGIRYTEDPKAADCVVGYALGTRLVADQYAGWRLGLGYGWGGGWGWDGFGDDGFDWPPVRNEGRISVDLFDAKTHMAIWHGSVNQDVTNLTGADAEARIDAAAAAIFSKFPTPAAPPPAAADHPVV